MSQALHLSVNGMFFILPGLKNYNVMLCDCLFCVFFRRSGRYNSCGDNHSIKTQNPEQYLTPLQQKEVAVRHLKTKLKESESKLKER